MKSEGSTILPTEARFTILHPLDPRDAEVVEQRRAAGASHKGQIDGPRARTGFDQLIAAVPAPHGVRFEAGEAGGVAGWWCFPNNARADVTAMFVHGGGYVLGSAAAFRNFAGQFAERLAAATFIPDYRLAPEHRFPAAFDDVRAGHEAIAVRSSSTLLVGDSAGGGLILALLAALAREGAHAQMPAAAAVMSPWTDLGLAGGSMFSRADADPIFTRDALASLAALYLGGTDPADPRASPLAAPLIRLPPIRVDVGDDEILLDDSRRYAAKAAVAGSPVQLHIWAGMSHVFPSSIGSLRAADAAVDHIAGFLRASAPAVAG